MPDINSMFPSKYLKASDLQGKTFTVVIDRVVHEKVVEEEPEKWCLYFSGSDRGMVLNKTNAMMIADGYGGDTDLWIGKSVELFTEKTQFQGKIVDGLRVRPASAQAHPNPDPPLEQPPVPATNADEDLPF